MRFEGKVVAVTGGAQGIGESIARRFASEGAQIVILDLNVQRGREVASSVDGVRFIECDVASPVSVEDAMTAVIAMHEGVDVLVNNAAVTNNSSFLELTETDLDRVLGVNLKAHVFVGQAVARQMIDRGAGGAIVNMSSITARLGVPSQAAYAASKGGVESLTRVMAVGLAEWGIRVNAVAPGSIATPMFNSFAQAKPELRQTALSRIPLRRLGEPADIAGVVAFLASDDAAYVTGQVIYPDGGRTALNYTVPVDN